MEATVLRPTTCGGRTNSTRGSRAALRKRASIEMATPGPTNRGFTPNQRSAIRSRAWPRGGTTLETAMARTRAGSTPEVERSWRARMPHSSEVRAWLVSTRHCSTSFAPSKMPSTVLVFPTSMHSSTRRGYFRGPPGSNWTQVRHVAGAKGLEAPAAAHQERARLVDVLGQPAHLAPLGAHPHLPPQRVGEHPPLVAHRREASLGVAV